LKLIHDEGKFEGKGGAKLYYQFWRPEKPKAAMVVVYGVAEHTARYLQVADHFANNGLAFYIFDLRGHGLSDGLKGHVDRFEDYVDDLDIFVDMVREK
jgi:acylglycerol lipase